MKTIFGLVPSKSNSYRITPNGLIKTEALKTYERSFYIQCSERGRNIEGYFELELQVFYPNQRSDLDGALKAVLDCLQTVKVIKNDNKCVKIVASKYLDKKSPRIEYQIKEVKI